MKRLVSITTTLLAILVLAAPASAARIKDIARIRGVRSNQLIGYGLVVGLSGTGDDQRVYPTVQSVASMLSRMGIKTVPDLNRLRLENVAAVMLTAELPPFARAGSRLDVAVSSMGNASSLQGGTLLMTPLKGVDGQVYAMAQGPLVVGGFAAGAQGTAIQKNHPTSGVVPGGALVEREVPFSLQQLHELTFSLIRPDFTTAARLSAAVNEVLAGQFAQPLDSGTVQVAVPEEYRDDMVQLVATIERLEVAPDEVARVVINEKTGTVIVGKDVRISTVAIAHGNLSVQVRSRKEVSQPNPFGQGDTVSTTEAEVTALEGQQQLTVVDAGIDIQELVRALNALGVSPRDLIAIFRAIKAAGALQAELEVL